MNPFPVILSAPSGGGKTAIARELLKRRPDVGYSVSATTRLPRTGEVDGRDYHFLSVAEFQDRQRRGEFAESAEVHGRLYGTLRREVERVLAAGRHVVMDIDVRGAQQFKAAFPGSVLVFVLPPSAEVLVARLTARKTEDPAALRVRLHAALRELEAVEHYQYVIVNDRLEDAVARVAAIIDAEASRRERVGALEGQVDNLIRQLAHEIDRRGPGAATTH
ncbi:MAG TPA: guanylate kinase [Gemmatimonadaceae bacterium]|nr:guanylate kinase [Gemmatimonadaceae bacterium]